MSRHLRLFAGRLFNLGVGRIRQHLAKIPLAPLLHALGYSHRDLERAWGPAIAAANAIEDNPALLRKYHERLLPSRDRNLPEQEKTKAVVARLAGMELDPEVTSRTLPGRTRLDRDAVLDVTKKLLAISKGQAEPDNRDDLAYQTVLGPEDIIAERLEKDYGQWRKKLLWRAARDRNLRAAVPGYLNRQVRSALLESGPLRETRRAFR